MRERPPRASTSPRYLAEDWAAPHPFYSPPTPSFPPTAISPPLCHTDFLLECHLLLMKVPLDRLQL